MACDLYFTVFLPDLYPEKTPILICDTLKNFPSISDGRDILPLVLNWDSSKNCTDIFNEIPNFLQNYELNEDIGQFHLLLHMPLRIWDKKPGMNWIFCTEIDPINEKIRRDRIIVVTHSHFLMLEPVFHNKNFGILIFWANLGSIVCIKKSKYDEDAFIIEWHPKLESNFQVFKCGRSKYFINLIIENLKKLGSISQSSYYLDIEEGIDKIKIYDILRKIERNERLLETFLDDEKLNGLVALYQKVVEYFSAMNDSRFEVYLNKLQNLFNDKRIMGIICNEIKVNEKVERRGRGKSMELHYSKEIIVSSKRKSVELSATFT